MQPMPSSATKALTDPAIAMLRHTVATLAYRAAKPLRDAPSGFDHFRAAPGTRTPAQILAHVDRVMVMAFGKVLVSGTRDEVIAKMRGQKVVVAHERTAAA